MTLFRFAGNWGHSNLFAGTDPVRFRAGTIDSLDLPPSTSARWTSKAAS